MKYHKAIQGTIRRYRTWIQEAKDANGDAVTLENVRAVLTARTDDVCYLYNRPILRVYPGSYDEAVAQLREISSRLGKYSVVEQPEYGKISYCFAGGKMAVDFIFLDTSECKFVQIGIRTTTKQEPQFDFVCGGSSQPTPGGETE